MYPRGDRLLLLMAFVITGLLSPVPCKSQVLTARFYPEKQTYFIGEPIFVFVEVTNSGELPVFLDGRYGVPCFAPEPIMDHPGTYEVRTRRRIDIYSDESSSGVPIARLDVASEFKIALTTGNEKQLKAAFEPYVPAATSTDPIAQYYAVAAITTMAPRFLEDVILRLADVPNQAVATISALESLNTRRTRKKLAELAEQSENGGVRQFATQMAISALARTGDRAAIPALKRIAEYGQDGDREVAVFGLGHFGKDVIPFFTATLRGSDLNMQVAAIRGLGISASRSAVPILIALLHNSELQLVNEARLSLAELTHYSIDSMWMQNPVPREYERWNKWWQKHGATAEIYSTRLSFC